MSLKPKVFKNLGNLNKNFQGKPYIINWLIRNMLNRYVPYSDYKDKINFLSFFSFQQSVRLSNINNQQTYIASKL